MDKLDQVVGMLMKNAREVDVPRRPTAVLKHPNAPVTGNMKYNAMKVMQSPNGMLIYMDTNIAPYVPYTNERWISPKWKGAKNPNENWWEKMGDKFANDLAQALHGVLKKV